MKEELQNMKLELDDIKNKIESNHTKINKNRDDIDHNSGALALLHTLNANSNKYFIIWIITFMAFLFSIGYNIYLLTSYQAAETTSEEVEQTNDGGGDNNYTRAGGDING